MNISLYLQYLSWLSVFIEVWTSRYGFWKAFQITNFIKILPVGAMTKLVVIFLKFAKAHNIFHLEEQKTNLMSLAMLFHFLCAQHVSDINISIIMSLRLFCWITTSVVLFCSLCVGDLVRLGLSSARVAGWVLQPATRTPPKTSRTISPTHNELRTRRPMW